MPKGLTMEAVTLVLDDREWTIEERDALPMTGVVMSSSTGCSS
jgi:hypothetical protein